MAGGEVLVPGRALADGAQFAAALLGAGLPAEAARHVREAGIAYADDELAEAHLRAAAALAPGHPAVLIAHYRYSFYKGRLLDALRLARVCISEAARVNRLHADWRRVRAGDADFGSYDALLPRFYLFSLKAYAYLQLRLGRVAEGRDAARTLLELDPSDKIGARVLLDVLAAAAGSGDE